MADADDEDLETHLLGLHAELQAMNIRLATLREVIQTDLGVTDAQYDAALAKVTEAVQALAPDGRTRH